MATFTSKPLGLLTLHLPHDDNRVVYSAEVAVPLLEGGLFYRGPLSSIDNDIAADLQLFVSQQIINNTRIDKHSTSNYAIYAEPTSHETDFFHSEPTYLVIYTDTENSQLFFGRITPSTWTTPIKFVYRDLNEPITIGLAVLIGLGVHAVLCLGQTVYADFSKKSTSKYLMALIGVLV